MLRGLRCLLLLCLAVLSCFAFSQTRSSAGLRGRVVDSSGGAVPQANIVLANAATAIQRQTTTDASGEYVFGGLPLTGTYTITIRKTGFAPCVKERIQLIADEVASLDCTLSVAPAATTILVSGTAEGVQIDSARLQTRLAITDIEDMPVLGRKMSSLPLVDSAVRPARGTGDQYLSQTLFVVDAGGRRQTTFAIDNATADDSWGRQTFFTSIPFSAVQEFSVLTDASSAEYGRTTGGAINVVTKSGTNNLHGDLLALWRPSSLEATSAATSTRAAETLAQGSGSISGPIVRDRTYFMVSGEYSAQQRDSAISSSLGPGVYTGEYRETMLLARFDHQLNRNHQLSLRLNSDRFDDTNPSDTVGALNLPSTARTYTRHTYAAQLSETASIGARLLNEFHFQFQLGSPMSLFVPVTPSSQFIWPGQGVAGESRSNNILNHQYQLADTVSITRRRHNLKFGADVIYSSSGGYGQEFGGGYVLGQFTVKQGVLTPLHQLTINDISKYTQSFGNFDYNVRETLWALFLQDDISVTPGLTLNLGLRYERQTFTDATKNFAPRIGFAYKLPWGNTVLRGGYNVFYSELRANLAANWTINGPAGMFTYQATPGDVGFPTSLTPFSSLPTGANVPARDIYVRPGERAYLNQFFDVSKLRFYPDALLNPYTQQWSLGLEHELATDWVLSVDYVGQHTIRIDRPVDLNAPDPFVRTAQGQMRKAADADKTRPILPVPGGYKRIVAIANLGSAYYNGLQVNLRKRFSRRLFGLASYTWSHTLGTIEADASAAQQDPNDSNFVGRQELANSLLDQRHRFVLTGWYELPWKLTVGTSTSVASGRPYNVTTGSDNNGDNVNTDRPVVNGVVVSRNWGKGTATADMAVFAQKQVQVSERATLNLRAEAFNLLNHANIYGRNGVYGNGSTPAPGFGSPLPGINNVDPARSFQFVAAFRF